MSKESQSYKLIKKKRRHLRTRAKIKGTAEAPRLSVFRSNKHIFAQLINDSDSKTIASASDIGMGLKDKKATKSKTKESVARKINIAKEVGKLIAEKAKKIGIGKVVFDRGGLKYHGRIKSVADGAREGGLKF
ncbi:50S ribosomal protein L18 [Patescibacteria group bacterium]|nr:50S ribosomal protein L18 [Patescibacteria group bacterium]MBU4056728.1 50S ribosomal protein L18 [Patescibacteria group bacterium]MBU4369025.1 50S ribosomal protein L18 [Patescibacteria group bacterium]